jgi:hypothetical protein
MDTISETYKKEGIMTDEKAKELALVAMIMREDEILNGTIFRTFDKLYEVAEKFVEKYGVDEIEWGIDLEYEETVISFGREYVKENNLR